jgi:uncharacterized membrane protein YphA (DoxX/SURF4 family)
LTLSVREHGAAKPSPLFIRKIVKEILLNLLRTDGDWAIAPARIVLGLVMFAHGAQKLLGCYGGSGLGKTMQMLTTYVKLPKALVGFERTFSGRGFILEIQP